MQNFWQDFNIPTRRLATLKLKLSNYFCFKWRKWFKKDNTSIIIMTLDLQKYKCIVLYDMWPFVLSSINILIDYKFD